MNKTVQPVRQKLRRLPLSTRKEVSAELNRLLQAGIIERVDASEWVSPLVVARRRGGKPRLCVDLREPNKSVIMDCYPLPHMDDIFELAGATHYSQIDLSSAYHPCIPTAEISQHSQRMMVSSGSREFLLAWHQHRLLCRR